MSDTDTPSINDEGRQLVATDKEHDWIDISDDDPDAPMKKYKPMMEGDEETPYGHIVKCGPGTEITRHYHLEDQWLIVVEGSCTFEGEEIEAYAIQYTDERTPYGPFVAGEDGLTFIVVRPTAKDFEATHYV